jgi:hypothetical protein
MKQKPILFSTPMVQAILEGRKKMTRRIIKPQPSIKMGVGKWIKNNTIQTIGGLEVVSHYMEKNNPYGQPGDTLWVRETFTPYIRGTEDNGYIELVKFTADGTEVPCKHRNNWDDYKQRPSIFMPKEAARIFLTIKSVRVERLQDISEANILAEGVRYRVGPDEKGFVHPVFMLGENCALSFMPDGWKTLREKQLIPKLLFAHWAELWCKINGRESWDANPWVWVIEWD